jgi:hypothetical protein
MIRGQRELLLAGHTTDQVVRAGDAEVIAWLNREFTDRVRVGASEEIDIGKIQDGLSAGR